MKRVLWTAMFAAAAVAAIGAQATSNAMNAKEKANLQHVRSWWLECLEGRNLEATAKYQADGYIQHNINFPTGRAGFMKIFGERFKAAGGPVTPPPKDFANPPVVQFAKGDFVVLIWQREGKDPSPVQPGTGMPLPPPMSGRATLEVWRRKEAQPAPKAVAAARPGDAGASSMKP